MLRTGAFVTLGAMAILASSLMAAGDVPPPNAPPWASPGKAAGLVYIVDQNHPQASDTNPGTPEAPWKTIAKASAAAKADDTVCVMEGVYPEQITFAHSGAEGKPIVFRGVPRHNARISGWKCQGDTWAAPLAAKPTRILKDGGPFAAFTHDDAAKTVVLSGFDPRLHLMETVVRQSAIDLSSAPATKIEGIATANTLGEVGEERHPRQHDTEA